MTPSTLCMVERIEDGVRGLCYHVDDLLGRVEVGPFEKSRGTT